MFYTSLPELRKIEKENSAQRRAAVRMLFSGLLKICSGGDLFRIKSGRKEKGKPIRPRHSSDTRRAQDLLDNTLPTWTHQTDNQNIAEIARTRIRPVKA